jgi:uncharacterized caspase-like protein
MNRRGVLKAGLATGSLFLPAPYAWVWAQSDGALKLLRAPKVALVIGNGKYKDAPELKNAPNDAKAVSEVLKVSGFAVTMHLDTGREALVGAIRDYVNAMAQKKAVGLFYFAGHGVQLEWRNYMLPVDAVIDKVEDVAKQSVDIARLMEGLTKAANPMNMIILDACRENPFGTAKPVAQKGLSQMDAPTHTILAYATSPGNVASDGEGVNGLYTENLLREMKVPEAKIEDVFKRVRLGVRRKTNGAQIPWESTSLEDDFWFLPPRELKAASDAEKTRLFEEELAAWEKVKAAAAPGPLEEFLRRYSSGPFSELAQLQLDTVLAKQGEKKILIAPAVGNPYTQGFVPADTDFRKGDSYSYAVMDRQTRAEMNRITSTVTQINENEIVFDEGVLILDRLGNSVKLPSGNRFTPRQDSPAEYAVGKKWSTRYSTLTGKGNTGDSEFHFRITKREKVTVPAGSFDCFVIEGEGYTALPSGRSELRNVRWMAPDRVRRPIVQEQYRKFQRASTISGKGGAGKGGPQNVDTRMELTSYKQT